MIIPMVLDFETSISKGPHGPDAKDPSNDFYTTIYGDVPDRVVLEHNKAGFGRMLPNGVEEMLKTSTHLVGHNLGFDLAYVWENPCIRNFLLDGGKVWDTQVAEYILTAQQHQYSSLGELQEKYLGQKQKIDRISYLYSDKKKSGHKKDSIGADEILKARHRCPRLFKLYEEYCYLDGSTSLRIFKAQYMRAKQEGMLDIIMLYQDYLLGLTNMSCTGIQLDVLQCEKTLTDFNLKSVEYLDQAQKLIKPLWNNPRLPEFNINSGPMKSAMLFGGEVKTVIKTKVGKYKNGNDKYSNVEHKIWVEGFGVPKNMTRKTKKEGVYVTDDAVMQQIEKKTNNPKLKKYCELQKEAMMYKKAAKTYVQAFLELSIDGVLYPNCNNTTVITGRLSSSKPNLQNIAKRNKFGKILHKLFVAPPGWKCVQIDFGQLEIWVSAFLSGDEQLIADLQAGIDMHCLRVSYMQDVTYEYALRMCKELADPQWVGYRSAAKEFSYQRAYGAGVTSLIESTGLDRDVLLKIIEKEEARYPKAANLWREVSDSIENTKTFSKAIDVPRNQKSERNTHKGINLLPIFDNYGNIVYNEDEWQKIGYWQSVTGKKYHFPETGNIGKHGLRRSVTPTIMKNYPMQGTAADIQGATTATLLMLLLKNNDKIRMINEVHDSKWFYIKEEYVDRILPKLRERIENVPKIFKERFGIDVPFNFPIDIEIGDNFAEMERYNG